VCEDEDETVAAAAAGAGVGLTDRSSSSSFCFFGSGAGADSAFLASTTAGAGVVVVVVVGSGAFSTGAFSTGAFSAGAGAGAGVEALYGLSCSEVEDEICRVSMSIRTGGAVLPFSHSVEERAGWSDGAGGKRSAWNASDYMNRYAAKVSIGLGCCGRLSKKSLVAGRPTLRGTMNEIGSMVEPTALYARPISA
jgi:hypothetical protein